MTYRGADGEGEVFPCARLVASRLRLMTDFSGGWDFALYCSRAVSTHTQRGFCAVYVSFFVDPHWMPVKRLCTFDVICDIVGSWTFWVFFCVLCWWAAWA